MAQEVWNSSSSGLWSTDSKWSDATAPTIGGGDSLALTFRLGGSLAAVSTNDLGAFRLNQLAFEWTGSGLLTLASAAGSELQFAGANPTVEVRTSGPTAISSGILFDASLGSVRVTGAGESSLTWSGDIREANTPQALVLDAPGTQLMLKGNNTFSGGVTLKEGTLSIGGNSGLGTGTLSVLGGALRVESGIAAANPISLGETLVVTGTGGTLSGSISGQNASAGLALRAGSGTLRITGPTTYTGLATIGGGSLPNAANTTASLRLTDNGTLQGTSGIEVRAGGGLIVEASSHLDRISDTAPILLHSSHLILNGGNEAATEVVGALSVSGYSQVTLSTAAENAATVLRAAELRRVSRGTLLLRGTMLGSGTDTTGTRLLLTTEPMGMIGGGGSGPLSSIVPWTIGDVSSTGAGSSLVTYTASEGLRPLHTSEYANWSTATPQSNVRLTASTALGAVNTINALVLAGGSITGAGTLNVTSGTILAATTATIGPVLNFGSAEANIFTVGSLVITGPISGTGGLTKSGSGTLTLQTNNSFSGPLTVNAGTVSFAAASRLGTDTSPIMLGGNGVTLEYAGSSPLSLARGLQLREGVSRISINTSASGSIKFTVAGAISGPGGLHLSSASNSARVFELTGANTYTGPTRITGTANAVVASDTAFGNGGTLELATSGTLSLADNWQTDRPVLLTGGGSLPLTARINTEAFTATLNGPVRGAGALVKSGAGTLKARGDSAFSGTIRLEGGTMELSGMGAVRSTSWTLLPGAALSVDNTTTARDERIARSAAFTLNGNRISLTAHDQTSTTEIWNRLLLSGTNEIVLAATGAAGITLQLTQISSNGPNAMLLVRGDNLGGGPTGAWTRIVPTFLGMVSGGASGMDFAPGVYLSDPVSGLPVGFVLNDRTKDSAGTIGLRGVRPEEFVTGIISNAANGGTTPTTGHVLVAEPVTASGVANIVQTITLQPGATMTLATGQMLTVESGSIFAQAGGISNIVGGTLDLGRFRGQVYTAGDLVLGGGTAGTGTLFKLGPGTLTFSGAAQHASTDIRTGTVRITGSGALGGSVTINPGTTLAIDTPTAAVGALLGTGVITISDGHRLTIGTGDTVSSFGGVISGPGRVTINGGPSGDGLHTLYGANTFAGGVTLQSGRLVLGHNSALGTGPVTMAGGALHTSKALEISNAFVLDQPLRFGGYSLLTLKPGSAITGSADILVLGQGGLTLETTSAHTGETRAEFVLNQQFSSRAPITLAGANGSIAASSAIRLAPGSSLVLDNTTAAAALLPNGRIGDNTPVDVTGAELRLTGNAAAAVQETIGFLRGSGFATVTVAPASTNVSTALTSAALERNGRATFLFRQPTGSQIVFTTVPAGLAGGGGTGREISILPYAVGDTFATGKGSDLLTYEPGLGLRPLTPAEYVGDFASATATSNVRLGSAASLTTDVTLNALLLGGFNFNNLGTTHITSGALVKTGWNKATVGGSIAFGTAEGNIFVSGDPSSVLDLGGPVSGTNGLTKSGTGLLRLSGNNPFTGPLTINAGVLEFDQVASLGVDTSAIVMNGGERSPHLRHGSMAPATLTRGINVVSGLASFSSASQLTITGTISGPGGVSISPQSSADGEVVLMGTNTYAGPTIVFGGLGIETDASLGTNSRLVLMSSGAAGGLRLLGPWVSNRTVDVTHFGAPINTNGYDALLTGPVVSASSANATLSKSGVGTLTLTADSSYDGAVAASGGTLRLAEGARLAASRIMLLGGELLLDNTTNPISGRLSGVNETTPLGGRFTLLGHPTEAISEYLGTIRPGGTGPTIFTLTAPGTATTTLQLSIDSHNARTPLVFRGDRLGEPIGDAGVTRVRLAGSLSPKGGVLPYILVDHSLTGLGNSFATYDSTTDASGNLVGVRPLRANEYLNASVIQTVENGGNVPLDANLFVDAETSVIGPITRVNTITFSGAAKLSLAPAQTLDLADAVGLLAQRGANAVIGGGIIRYGQPSLVTPQHIYGDGDLTFRGTLIENSQSVGNQPLHKSGGGTLTFDDTILRNDLRISAGTVRLQGNSELTGIDIDLEKNGTLAVGSTLARTGPISGNGTIQLGSGTLHVHGLQSNFAGQIYGSGTLEQRDAGSFFLETPVALTGTLGVGRDPARSYQTGGIGGPFFLFSKEGSALAASAISVGSGGGFAVDARNGTQRISAVPIAINGGTFTFRSELQGGMSKLNVGAVTAQGIASLTASQLYSGTGAHLEVATLDRLERGIFRIALDTSLSAGFLNRITATDGLASVLVGTGTTSKNLPVVPFGVYARVGGNGSSLLTYEPEVGLRPLDLTTEYSYALTAGDNVWTNGAHETPPEGITVNSFGMSGTLSGSGALRSESGVIRGAGTISSPLSFGDTEAIFYPYPLSVTGTISGTAGLTVANILANSSATAELELRGENTFTGPLTLNSASVRFFSAENLGPDQSQIVSNDGHLIYAGNEAFILARPMRTSGFQASLATAGTGRLTLAGAITGPGGLRIRGDVALTGSNSYEGYTEVDGRLTIGSDAALGSGPLRIGTSQDFPYTTGTLALAGDWITDRKVQIGYSSTEAMRIDTDGFNATINGMLTQDTGQSAPSLQKVGAGTLLLRNAAGYFGHLAIDGGTVAINGAIGGYGSLNVGIDGRLAGIGDVPRNISVQGTLAPGLTVPGLLTTGNLTFSEGATLSLQFASALEYDRIAVNGNLLLNGATALVLDFLFDPLDFSDSFLLLANDGIDAIGGAGHFTFGGNALEEGATFFAAEQAFRISYTGGTGNDVVLSAVPEPTAAALLAIGLGALGLRRGRRRVQLQRRA